MADTLRNPSGYLQRRVALFARLACVIVAVMLAVDISLGNAPGEALFSSTRIAALSVTVTYAAIWLLSRRGVRPGWQSRALDLLGTTVAMAAFATLPIFPPFPGVAGVMAVMTPIPMAMVVMLRAAIIPSPPWLSALVALVWGGTMTYCAVTAWADFAIAIPTQDAFSSTAFPLAHNLFATLGTAWVAAVVSHVVHGLQSRVREAMQLGQYTLEAKIGEGGMGAVYRARHALLRRPTAVKLLPPARSSEQAIARFEREVQETSRLTHPNTVAIFDFGRTSDGVFYYAMEYLDGISLEDLVDICGPLPADRTFHIVTQAAEALAEAHAVGLVHRDIKPANIVLCERGGIADVAKVLDFGLVKDVDAPKDSKLSAPDALRGTPPYMAPETLVDPEAADARSDLYALGAVAYFLLTGKTLFDGNLVEVLSHHLHTVPPRPSERRGEPIESMLEAVVMRCLEKNPEARYGSAAELVSEIERCPGAHTWTRQHARAWWKQNRARIDALHTRLAEPTSLTITARRLGPLPRGRRGESGSAPVQGRARDRAPRSE